jgi:hypothetical protein
VTWAPTDLNRSATEAQQNPCRDLLLAFAGEVSDFLRLCGDFGRPAVRTAFFAGLSYARLHPVAQNVALELGEHRERTPARSALSGSADDLLKTSR